MAAASFYKFVNPRGVRSTGGTATIAGKKYQTKPDGTPRAQVLAMNRIGGQLNEQTKILQSIKTSIDRSTRGSIRNAKLVNDSIKGLATEDRKRKINEAKAQRQAAREARIAASRARLGARESGLEARAAAARAGEGSTDMTPDDGGGFFASLGKFFKTLLLYGALKWLSNEKNARMAVDFLRVLIKVGKAIFKFVEFGVISALEGFTNMFGSDRSLLDRLKGFLQFAVGIFSLFLVNRYLKNPFKLIKDVKRVFRAFRLIPKALGLAAKAGKALVMATKTGVMKMKGFGMAGLAKTALVAVPVIAGIGMAQQASTPSADPKKAAAGGTQLNDTLDFGGVSGDPFAGAFETGGIVPFRTGGRPPHAQSGGRIITGRNSGYRARVGGGAIEAHGTEAVVPLKNRYTDSGNDPLAAILGNSKKMAQGMATLVPMPLKMAGAGILVGLGALLGKLPFGIGNMLGPIAKTLMSPILSVFGVDSAILDKAMGLSSSNEQAGKDFGKAMVEAIKEWFKSILPGGGGTRSSTSTTSPASSPASTPPDTSNITVPEYDLDFNEASSAVQMGGKFYKTDASGALGDEIDEETAKQRIARKPFTGTPNWTPLLDLIASGEGDYNSVNPGLSIPGLSNMTIQEAYEVARKKGREAGGTGAMGRYQLLSDPIGRAINAGLVPGMDKFNAANQDKIAKYILEDIRFGKDWLAGDISDDQFQRSLAQEWAALAFEPSGKGAYDHTPGNKAKISWDATRKAMRAVKGQRMFLGGIAKGIGKAIGGIGKTVAKIAPIAASFIPGVGPLASAAIGGISGLMSGGGIGGFLSGALGGLGGIGGLGSMLGGSIGGFMQSAGGILDGALGGLMGGGGLGGMLSGALGGAGGLGNILAQGGEMIFGPGFTSMFGGTLDALNVGGKGLSASNFLKKAGMGALDFAVGKIAGSMGGPDAKNALVPGGSTVLNVNAVKMISALMKSQQVAQNSAKIQNLEGATTILTDKLVKVTSDVIAGVLVDKGKMAELPPAINDQAMAQILPMIQSAIVSASQQAAQQGGGAPNPGFQKSSSGANLTSTVAGSIGSIAGKILGGGVK